MPATRVPLALLILAISLIQLAALAPVVAADPVASKSLIANGDFEADANADQWPDGWARAKSQIGWQEEKGNHFLRLESKKPGEMVMLYHAVKLPEGTGALTLRWRIRCANLKPGKQSWFDARILLDFKDSEGNKLAGGPSTPYLRKSTEGWAERSISFLVPEGARALDFMPALFQVESGMLGLIQKHKLHWTGFSFHPKASPVMITGWEYKPTPFWGQFAKDAFSGKQFELKKLR